MGLQHICSLNGQRRPRPPPLTAFPGCHRCAHSLRPARPWVPCGLLRVGLPPQLPPRLLLTQNQLWVGLQYHRLGDQLLFEEVRCPVSSLRLSLASVSDHLSLPLARLQCVSKIIQRLLLDTPRWELNIEELVPLRTGRWTSLKCLKLPETSDTC